MESSKNVTESPGSIIVHAETIKGPVSLNLKNDSDHHEVNLKRLPLFVGYNIRQEEYVLCRKGKIKQIIRKLTKGSVKRVAITGIAGIGKTSLAISIARKLVLKNKIMDRCIFLFSESKNTLENSLRDVMGLLHINCEGNVDQSLQQLWTVLKDFKVLLIYDNVDDFQVISNYLPDVELKNFPLIITSQKQLHNTTSRLHHISLEIFSNKKSRKFIKRQFDKFHKENALKYTIPNNSISKIINVSAGYPLILSLMTSFINHKIYENQFKKREDIQTIVDEYIESLQDKLREETRLTDYDKSVQAAIEINLNKIQIECRDSGICGSDQIIGKVKQILTCCNPDLVPIELFTNNFKNNREDVEKVITSFQKHHIVTIMENKTYLSVHRLTQRVICNTFKPEEVIEVLDEWIKSKQPYCYCLVMEVFDDLSQTIVACSEKSFFDFCKLVVGTEFYRVKIILDCIFRVFSQKNLDRKIIKRLRIFCVCVELFGNLYLYEKFIKSSETVRKIFECVLEQAQSSTTEWNGQLDKLHEILKICCNEYTLHTWFDILWLSWWGNWDKLRDVPQHHLVGHKQDGWTILHIIAVTGDNRLFSLLSDLEINKIINKKINFYVAPIHLAIMCRNNHILDLLLKFDIDLKVYDRNRNNLLHYSAMYDIEKLARLITQRVDCKSLVNEQNEDDENALFMAVRYKRVNIVKLLIKSDINISQKNKNGETILKLAVDSNQIQVIEEINSLNEDIEKQLDIKNTLKSAMNEGRVEIVKCLLNTNSNIVKKKWIDEILFDAISLKLSDVAFLLIQKGVDVNMIYKNETVLHAVSRMGLPDVADILLNKKVNINVKDKNGRTPLFVAMFNGNTNVAKLIISKNNIFNDISLLADVSLLYVCEEGLLDTVKYLICNKVDINQKNAHLNTPLHLAVLNGHEKIAKYLLSQRNIKINETNKWGQTILHLASDKGLTNVVRLLLNKKVDVNQTDYDGNTPLHYAVLNSRVNIAKLLLWQPNIQTNVKNNKGDSILHYASEEGLIEIVRLLINNQVDINETDGDGDTALHIATICRQTEVATLLLSQYHIRVNEFNKKKDSVLHYASKNGLEKIVRLLINKKVDINCTDADDNTPLHYAAFNDHENVVTLLLSQPNIIVNQTNKWGKAALHYASKNDSLAIVKSLSVKKANINQKDKDGFTPLHLAIFSQQSDNKKITKKQPTKKSIQQDNKQPKNSVVKFLISHDNIKIDEKNNRGHTAMHIASLIGSEEVVELLIDKNFDVNSKDENGYTPLQLAVLNGRKTVVELLLKKQNVNIFHEQRLQGKPILHWATLSGWMDIVKTLIEKNVDINQTDEDGKTALHHAVSKSDEQIASYLLLQTGIKVDEADCNGWTPLHYASRLGLTKIVNDLIDKDVDINQINNDGNSPLHLATVKKHEQIAELLLLQEKIKVNETNRWGETVLHYAAGEGLTRIVDILISKKVDVYKKNINGITPLDFAVSREHIRIIKMLQSEQYNNKYESKC